MEGSGGGSYTDLQEAKRRATTPPTPGGGPHTTRPWLIAASLAAVAVLGVGFLVIDTPQDQQHAHAQAQSDAAVERLAGWVQQAELEPTSVEAATSPSPVADGELVPAPTVTVTTDHLPLTVSWREKTRFAGAASDHFNTTEIEGHTVRVFDDAPEEAPAYAQLDCGLTSHLIVTVGMRSLQGADDLPPDGGQGAVMETVTALAGTIPCPQDLPLAPDN